MPWDGISAWDWTAERYLEDALGVGSIQGLVAQCLVVESCEEALKRGEACRFRVERFADRVRFHASIGGRQWVDISSCFGHRGSFVRCTRSMGDVVSPLLIFGLIIG